MHVIVLCCKHLMTFVPSMTFHVPVLFTPHECATSTRLVCILLSSSWKAHSLYISAGTQVYFRLLLSFCACKKSSSQGFTCLAAPQNCVNAGCTVLAHLRFFTKRVGWWIVPAYWRGDRLQSSQEYGASSRSPACSSFGMILFLILFKSCLDNLPDLCSLYDELSEAAPLQR